MKKIFYDPSGWRAFEAPEKPSICRDPYCKWCAVDMRNYEKAYAEAKENALLVGNESIIEDNSWRLVSSKDSTKDYEVYDWPGSAVIRDNKYYLEI